MEVKQGDLVISIYGQRGIVAFICNCDQCQKRGYEEPKILWDDGTEGYISKYDSEHGYPEFYKIGDHVFQYNARPVDLFAFIAEKQKDLRSLVDAIESAISLLQKVMK